MSRDHIIPQFILRGFAINPAANKQNQKIMIYDKDTKKVHTKKIADTYSLLDFNSPETEKYLANEYESKVAKIFQRASKAASEKQQSISLSNKEYTRTNEHLRLACFKPIEQLLHQDFHHIVWWRDMNNISLFIDNTDGACT